VPLAPLDQQKRIVAEIEKQFSRLNEAVAALKRIQANLKRYKASVLKAAVEGKLTEEWRSRRGEQPFAPTKDELINRDKASLDIFWLRDESLEDSDSLPEPDILAREIVEDLQAALVQFQAIAEDL